jgi:hypothetical protein
VRTRRAAGQRRGQGGAAVGQEADAGQAHAGPRRPEPSPARSKAPAFVRPQASSCRRARSWTPVSKFQERMTFVDLFKERPPEPVRSLRGGAPGRQGVENHVATEMHTWVKRSAKPDGLMGRKRFVHFTPAFHYCHERDDPLHARVVGAAVPGGWSPGRRGPTGAARWPAQSPWPARGQTTAPSHRGTTGAAPPRWWPGAAMAQFVVLHVVARRLLVQRTGATAAPPPDPPRPSARGTERRIRSQPDHR